MLASSGGSAFLSPEEPLARAPVGWRAALRRSWPPEQGRCWARVAERLASSGSGPEYGWWRKSSRSAPQRRWARPAKPDARRRCRYAGAARRQGWGRTWASCWPQWTGVRQQLQQPRRGARTHRRGTERRKHRSGTAQHAGCRSSAARLRLSRRAGPTCSTVHGVHHVPRRCSVDRVRRTV